MRRPVRPAAWTTPATSTRSCATCSPRPTGCRSCCTAGSLASIAARGGPAVRRPRPRPRDGARRHARPPSRRDYVRRPPVRGPARGRGHHLASADPGGTSCLSVVSPSVCPGRNVRRSRPWSSKPRAHGAPSKPASSRCRSTVCTVAVHGCAGRRTSSPTRTAPKLRPPGSRPSVIPRFYRGRTSTATK